jgi:hypothetical protein
MLTFYVWIDGKEFSPDDFQRTHGAKIGGNVKKRKFARSSAVNQEEKYWQSDVLQCDVGELDDAIRTLLLKLQPSLREIRDIPTLRIVMEIVQRYRGIGSVHGFYFSPQTIQMLAESDIAVDIDIVPLIAKSA